MDFVNTNIIVLTDKRLIVATKRIVFGYFFRMITPDMFNDLTIEENLAYLCAIYGVDEKECVEKAINRCFP